MTFDEVRVIRTYGGHPYIEEMHRTDAQKHTDQALDLADDAALGAAETFGESLGWAASIGVEIPARVRGVVTILGQWQKHLEDERKRRG
jgi:hypothetical protein